MKETPAVPKVVVGKLTKDYGEPRLKMVQRKEEREAGGLMLPKPIPRNRQMGANVYLQMLRNVVLPTLQLQDQSCCSISSGFVKLNNGQDLEDKHVRMLLNWDHHHHQEHVSRYNLMSITYAHRYAPVAAPPSQPTAGSL
ncbi:MAG: hypothetical protein M1837_005658 [Sclerophora amabilis]|nr:MAG: hypothetical protein M1837_005658 [Sclerophora amabilis]